MRLLLLGAAGCVLLFAIVAIVIYFWLEARPSLQKFESAETGVSLQYDADLTDTTLTKQDKADKVILKLQNHASEPGLLVSVRHEDGLRPISTITKQDLQTALLSNVSKTYPERFPEYRQLSTRNFDVNGKKASEVVFTYQNQGETIKQRFVFVIKNDDMAVYLSAQAKENDFASLNKKYFDPIFNSLQIE